MNILVVEDDALVGFVLKSELMNAGYQVAGPVATAEEALQLAAATQPTLALVNIDLADNDNGVEVARALRERFGTICLFVSGDANEARAARDVVIGYIANPCDPATVLAAVKVAKAIIDGREPERIPHGLELFRDV